MSNKGESKELKSAKVVYHVEIAKVRGETRDPLVVMRDVAGAQMFELGEPNFMLKEQRIVFPIQFEDVPQLPLFCDLEFI